MCCSRNEHAPLKLDQSSTFSFLESQFCRRFFLFTFRPRRLIIISRFVTLSRFSLRVDHSCGRVSSKFRHGYKKKKKKKKRYRERGRERFHILVRNEWLYFRRSSDSAMRPVSIIMLAILSRTSSTMCRTVNDLG